MSRSLGNSQAEDFGKKRISSKVIEIIVDTDAIDADDLSEYRCNQ